MVSSGCVSRAAFTRFVGMVSPFVQFSALFYRVDLVVRMVSCGVKVLDLMLGFGLFATGFLCIGSL
jgi:hypothetical protein